ncbi:MAG: peptidoglycan DD-metalloendopeptidase family protein [Anaerolineae bacterium]|nr:peptidoglycan DD-metalloendopeptidase family protein [Anaerolineae bacterium]
MATPYDGKIAVWHVHGRTVGENTIDEVIETIREYAPAVNAIWVKVGEGTAWMGNIGAGDPKTDLAIRGPADIDRWVMKLERAGLEFHAWAIPFGANPAAEADFLIQTASRPGVRSLILDVEPFEGYFRGGRSAVRPLMLRLRNGLPAAFHIGMSVDPRPWHYETIFPDEWRPFINSVHPQVYWADFGLSPDAALAQAWESWGAYGLPIIPVLQGYQGRGERLTRESMDRARTVAIDTYKAPGLSWFRFGTLNRTFFPAVNVSMSGAVPGGGTGEQPRPIGQGRYGTEIVVKPGDPGWREGTYDGTPSPLANFPNEEGWSSRYFRTSSTASNVWVRWDPQVPTGGFWEISVYVPAQHSTTNNARYKIHGIVGQTSDYEVAVVQTKMDSIWVPLGIFNLDASQPNAGVIFLNDLTGELNREITFDAIRWRQVLGWQRPPRFLADGFDAPVGASEERMVAATTWPASWSMTLGYRVRYRLGGRESLHTGNDFIIRRGRSKGQPLYATASGEVITAQRLGTGSWGNVVIIRHDPLLSTGQVVYSRYGHVDDMQVRVGERVARGQFIATIGDAYGYYRGSEHLHFDISGTRTLAAAPADWPWLDGDRLDRDYLNPTSFVFSNRPVKP